MFDNIDQHYLAARYRYIAIRELGLIPILHALLVLVAI